MQCIERDSDTKQPSDPENQCRPRVIHVIIYDSNFTSPWSGDGAVVRALASHQCGPDSLPGPGVICGLSLLLVLVLAPRVFLRFSSLHKNQHFQLRSHISGQKATYFESYLFINLFILFTLRRIGPKDLNIYLIAVDLKPLV